MIKHLLKYKWYIVAIFVLIVVTPSIDSVMNFILQNLFNSATPGGSKLVVMRLLTKGFLLWLLKRILLFVNGVLKTKFICNVKRDVKHKIFVNLMGLDIAKVSKIASSGEYISVLTNDITMLETRYFSQIIGLISAIMSVLILGSSFLALNSTLAAAILIFGIVSMFIPKIFSSRLNDKSIEYSDRISKFTQKAKEYMVAFPTIKNYSIERSIISNFDFANQETEDSKFEADYELNLANSIGQLISWFMQLIGIGLGLIMVIKGQIMIGTVIAARSFASDLASPLQEIVMCVNSIRSVSEIIRKINAISSSESNMVDNDTNSQNSLSSENSFDVCFDSLNLQLGGTTIINNFSFNFEAGKKYLMIGLNGSGKSSIFRVLKKWFDNCTGNVSVSGRSLKEIDNDELSRIVSYLNENVSLFSGTIKDNISLFNEFDGDVFDKALTDAKIELDIERSVDDDGRNISSGEQRRIEIARSLIRSVKVLIFDEVVSTLDIETAYEIEKMALSLTDKTVIFISHNFSGKLIDQYDEILVMKDGCLINHGSYDELIKACDYFKNICEIKFGKNLLHT